MLLAATLAIALLGPLQHASTNAQSLELRGDHRQRPSAVHSGIANDPAVVQLDHQRVGGEIELTGAPLVAQILERVIRRAEIGDVTSDQHGQYRRRIIESSTAQPHREISTRPPDAGSVRTAAFGNRSSQMLPGWG
jgi:hypothetical protein